MKPRVLVSLIAITLAGAAAIGGTVAYFSDTEVSKGNNFTAGALNLQIDSTCHYDNMICAPDPAGGGNIWQNEPNASSTYPTLLGTACSCSWLSKDLAANDLFFNFDDVKPGDKGEDTISLTTNNNDSWLCAYVQNLSNNDNGCNGPEMTAETVAYGAGSETCATSTAGIGQGELQDNLFMQIWKDNDCDNLLDTEGLCVEDPLVSEDDDDAAECALQTNNGQAACEAWIDTPEETVGECNWVTGASETILLPDTPINSNDHVWPLFVPQLNEGAVLPGGVTNCIGFGWSVATSTNNIIQTDSVTGDVGFLIEQSRNNPNFTCPQALP